VAQNTNKEKNNKLPLILSVTSLVLVIISIIINILWFQYLDDRFFLTHKFILDVPSRVVEEQNKAK
jgi:hypothetical protein